ncbi:16S rRNA (cytosine(1402)-N(4))-methyltransferase RsmH [Arcobacter cryaerophilus gv. pseudocryaerophilus]|uniref:Ribosomal RNA small subunit methyltransferase H n=3 Tax=unclassified Arcobacter TaxID=2593671 RepID=A0AA96L5K1_9BACT|nr:16S rRNA (cytosine(1402)-N(4))-methyltransferase RsmH [Aliarcobacter cryaerophilus]WNL27970.1 16S rRNA (cytosine(1402)-N(4))-methyltransferase RsmH [Arcobacter sp. AZ-2023]WPD04875.1 16S rRNA (cytosine(1402)-N(4))-methyltransferase RsmH [Arcobacter sp. DSM 115956]WPD06970.1 16S rRNA (cytosine(1402)-N(4))-methyltransferase RsmH [Arcobacter sp. DSM 115955]MCT7498885.1 16S rRNA (cytosine(1402)-N(4))-methyltransferase RsmH [Aliarcobacter cryaerophilus]QNM91377.1 16S rRNA (cytosine(1402)-N(4))-m
MQNIPHIPVLYNEVLDCFKDINKGYIIDCTTGYAGHSSGLLNQNSSVKLICNDQDDEALNFSKNRLKDFENRVEFNKGNFENIIKKFENYPIRGVLADIGVSSLQLDKLDRGFSFNSENLDMRMNQNQSLDASTVINSYSQVELENIFKDYGEIREYKKIASLIVQNRPFYSAKELAEFFYNKLPKGKIHPATLIFQAIRIEVNDELGVLDRLFKSMEEAKLKDCIVAIISFHSLEDRVVKNYFKKWSENCICPKDAFRCECGKNHALGKIITKKPIIATNFEIKQNPRSRSAKLRVFRFV